MYCTCSWQQQQKQRGNGINVIAYLLPLFVIKLFVMCDSVSQLSRANA